MALIRRYDRKARHDRTYDIIHIHRHCARVRVYPGPATLLTVARATTSGARVGVATGAGIAVGDVLHTLMAVIGISAIIATSAVLFSIVKYLGAAYLVYLGLRAIFETPPTDAASARASGVVALTAPRAFRQAVLARC